MLRIVKKDLKPLRHRTVESEDEDIEGDDDDEDILGVEDADDNSDVEITETADIDDKVDESNVTDDEMDDAAMFRLDAQFTQFLKKSGSDSASAQLTLFKLRVLSLLEIYLHKNSGIF